MTTLDLGQWCILRMSSANTLAVHDSLKRAGFEVWTPVELSAPAKEGDADKRKAMLDSYVFADASHMDDLTRVALTPGTKHPRFWMFEQHGGFPLVAEHGLRHVRAEEDRRRNIFERQKRRGRPLPVHAKGAVVRLSEGGFAGLSGTVVEQRGKWTLVDIPGFAKPIEISSILLPDAASVEQQNKAA